eukprot:2395043-Alexandrium_andersonii.AAC.1
MLARGLGGLELIRFRSRPLAGHHEGEHGLELCEACVHPGSLLLDCLPCLACSLGGSLDLMQSAAAPQPADRLQW